MRQVSTVEPFDEGCRALKLFWSTRLSELFHVFLPSF